MPDRVLIIDDDPILRHMVRSILELAEYEAFEAVDGPDGLAQAARRDPDIILLDLMMPGMDGYETCRGLKADPTTTDIPVIFVTASADPTLNRRAYAAGAVACIPKPFRREALLATIDLARKQALRRPGHGAPPRGEARR